MKLIFPDAIARAFPTLSDPGLATSILNEGQITRPPAGAVVFRAGDQAAHFLMVIKGEVVVRQYSERGRMVVLYRVGPGQTCILTTSCLMGGEVYPAEAVVEKDVVAIALPRGAFDTLLAHSAPFRRFIFADLGERLGELMRVIDAIAFEPFQARLAAKLLERAGDSAQVQVTQQALADEVGGAREAVNRRLADLAHQGVLRVSRGCITLIDRRALARIAEAGAAPAAK